MNRTLRNVVAVVVLTAFTAVAVVATVQATGRIVGTDTATAAGATAAQSAAQQTSSGTAGQSSVDQSSSGQSTGGQSQSTGPYGYPSSVYTPDADGLMYCPRTGCAATSCHALQ